MATRALVPLTVVALSCAACVEPDPPHDGDAAIDSTLGVSALSIDAGGRIELVPGEGIGVGVEYAEGGRWTLTTACDTAVSAVRCTFDLLVSTDDAAGITRFEGAQLDEDDRLRAPDPYAVSALFETDVDNDGFGFDTAPGATVRVSALLYDPRADSWFDWSDDPRIISWVGHGAVHRGAPTNPVDLTPDRP